MRNNYDDMEMLLDDISSDCGGKDVRDNYCGRAMFGKTCWGIVCSDYVACIETAALHGMTGAKVDNMGLDWIVYWPHPRFTDECLEQYDSTHNLSDEEE